MMEENNISPIRSDFEQIKKQNESGSEYWTSRDLCVALGYSTYQKFTRTINKAIAIANHKKDLIQQSILTIRLKWSNWDLAHSGRK